MMQFHWRESDLGAWSHFLTHCPKHALITRLINGATRLTLLNNKSIDNSREVYFT